MRMNLPNKLTIGRIILVPVVCALLLWDRERFSVTAGILFIAASLTDALDGYIARKYHLITNFGKFMDPLADKLLICLTLACLAADGAAPGWTLLVILAREFAIDGFRMIAVERGLVIAASGWGKRKANFQTLWLIALLFPFETKAWQILTAVLMWIAVALTVISFIDYIAKNRKVLSDQ